MLANMEVSDMDDGDGKLRSVHEVSELAGVSVRTLHHYDQIGLLRPSTRTDAGYRLYAPADLERLQQILLFRELEFSLKDIKAMLESPRFDKRQALDQQIKLLELKRDHIDGLLALAKRVKTAHAGQQERTGEGHKEEEPMGFEAFDTSKLDEYKEQAKATWGKTAQWQEYEGKSKGRTSGDEALLGEGLMGLFVPFGRMAAEGADPQSDAAQEQAHLVQAFISEHFYACTDEVFLQLGRAYGSGGEFTTNINAAAGAGAAEFAAKAIELYCKGKEIQ